MERFKSSAKLNYCFKASWIGTIEDNNGIKNPSPKASPIALLVGMILIPAPTEDASLLEAAFNIYTIYV